MSLHATNLAILDLACVDDKALSRLRAALISLADTLRDTKPVRRQSGSL